MTPMTDHDQRQLGKIADRLSFVDARIAIEDEEPAALKTRKMGLMQQLFPSPERD